MSGFTALLLYSCYYRDFGTTKNLNLQTIFLYSLTYCTTPEPAITHRLPRLLANIGVGVVVGFSAGPRPFARPTVDERVGVVEAVLVDGVVNGVVLLVVAGWLVVAALLVVVDLLVVIGLLVLAGMLVVEGLLVVVGFIVVGGLLVVVGLLVLVGFVVVLAFVVVLGFVVVEILVVVRGDVTVVVDLDVVELAAVLFVLVLVLIEILLILVLVEVLLMLVLVLVVVGGNLVLHRSPYFLSAGFLGIHPYSTPF